MASALHPTPEMIRIAQEVLMDGGTVEDMLIAVTPMIATAVMQEAQADLEELLQRREVHGRGSKDNPNNQPNGK